MSRFFTFNVAIIIVVILAGLAFIQQKWSSPFAGLLLVYLVLASIVPVVMVPVGIVVIVWNVLQTQGLGDWLNKVSSGPAAGITGLNNNKGQSS